jgi:hypothetical protein
MSYQVKISMKKLLFLLSLGLVFSCFSCGRTDIKNPEDYFTVFYEISRDETVVLDEVQFRNETGGIETITKVETPFIRAVYVKRGFNTFLNLKGHTDTEVPDLSVRVYYENDLKTEDFFFFQRMRGSGLIDFTFEKPIQ